MNTYKLLPDNPLTQQPADSVLLLPGTFIPFDPANTDYENFKSQINADEAQLEDADGNLMSPEEAKAFVATLP